MPLENKVCVITGAAGGLGQAIASGLAQAGAELALIEVDQAKADAAATACGTGRGYGCDVRSVAAIAQAFEQIANDYGAVNVLINAAGLANRTPIEAVTEEEWDLLSDVNLKGLFFCSQAAYRIMLTQGGGRIVNLSSTRALQHDGRHVIYDATKAAVTALTRTFAVAGGPHGITANSISPAYVLTEMTRHNLDRPGWYESITSNIPLGRMMRPEDIAHAVVFLASDLSASITGHDLVIDGGWTVSE
ncbi:MAG: SDR family oxidoreductase [Propionibacteriaceae bacterium]|jgi:NAD(P)-dependent dehydrogenase (short-subunit alcohol dehydrogenase family)|nr:SDR family oxidoreductase [Propionibacteriaceae bacterium]